MPSTVMIIGAGAMGAGVGRRLTERGCRVLSPLTGRSEATVARARAAGMVAASDEQAAETEFVLSIIPPGEAVATAQRFAPVIAGAARKPIYVDCNAINPRTVARVAAVLAPTGCDFVDGGIIGGPPRDGYKGPTVYASGANASEFADFGRRHGLNVQVVEGPVGAASAVKMSYAGITKGITGLVSAMMLASARAGTAETLRAELAASQPTLLAWFERQIPQMYSKAYRWIAEMDEIAEFVGEDPAAHQILGGTARLYERIAEDFSGDKAEVAALDAFLGHSATGIKAAE